MTLGKKIRFIREHLGLSQEDFAYKLLLTQCTISSYERDAKKPSYNNLVKIETLARRHKIEMKLL